MLQPLPRVGRRCLSLAIVATLAACASQSSALKPSAGYVKSDTGIARDSYNQCVKSSLWEKGMSLPECGGSQTAKAEASQSANAEAAAAEPQAEPSAATAQTEPAPAGPAAAAAAAAAPIESSSSSAAAAPAEPAEPRVVYLGTDAYFGFNDSELSDQAKAKLDRIAERASNSAEARVRVVGHADQVGEEDYNQMLSQRRADAVRTYLIDRGVAQDAVQVEARGETDPIVNCEGQQGASLIDCLQVNRRTEVEFAALEPVDR